MYNIEELEKIIPTVSEAGILVNIQGNYAIEYKDQTFKLEALFDQSEDEIAKHYKTMAMAPHVIHELIARLKKLDSYSRAMLVAMQIICQVAGGLAEGIGIPGVNNITDFDSGDIGTIETD